MDEVCWMLITRKNKHCFFNSILSSSKQTNGGNEGNGNGNEILPIVVVSVVMYPCIAGHTVRAPIIPVVRIVKTRSQVTRTELHSLTR